MRNKRFPNYPDDADYTTNAPSYYEDLARKEKLIRLLAERIWGYEELLDDSLEEIQERFRAWDKNLEDFPEDVKILLQQWLDDGTFDHIINETIFNWKLDTVIFEQFRDAITTQLNQIAYQLPKETTADELNALLQIIPNDSVILFEQKSSYNFDKPIVMPLESKNITINGNGSRVNFTNNTSGFILESVNQNYGSHRLLNMLIYGGNTRYPTTGGYIPLNTGVGVNLKKAYYTVIRDVFIEGFGTGLNIEIGIKNNIEGKTYIRFNQIGVTIAGGATNVNNFKGVSIRENRKKGIELKRLAGEPVYPTMNIFEGCLIESNIPYPYLTGGNAPNDSVGVDLNNSYDNRFINCYFENHDVSILIRGGSDSNVFDGCRFNSSADRSRMDKITFMGGGISNTLFNNCTHSAPIELINVEWDMAIGYKNQFIGCSGFTFKTMENDLDIINAKSNASNVGFMSGYPQTYDHSIYNNPPEGTEPARVNGIGTTSATLNALGYGEIILGNNMTAPTTLTNILNLRRGQYFVLTNYQNVHPITVQSSTTGTSGLVLKNKKDAVLRSYGDTLLFYVTKQGRIVEIGRNVSDHKNSNRANLLANETSIVVTHNLLKTPTIVNVTPIADVGNVWVSSINDTTFTINVTTSRTANTALMWTAEY